jgi:LacI family transcriptional regulator
VTVKLKDVARESGLSVAAVSRFLNGRIVLPEETQRRITEAARKLNYVPNAIARRLSAGTSETLGLITTDISYSFFADIASAAEAEAAALGYNLAIFNSRNELSREMKLLSRIADHQIDGALLLTNHPGTTELAELVERLGRVVLIDEDVPGATCPRVFADNERGGRLAARHFLDLGHRRVAFVGGPMGMISVEERRRGFAAELAAGGVQLDPASVLNGPFSEQFGQAALRALLSLPSPPTAIFTGADVLAFGMLRAARTAGMRVPQDFSLVSFDDTSLSDLLNPPLTTVRQSPAEFGRRGVRLLVDVIEGTPVDPSQTRVSVELVVRGSTAAPRMVR